MQLSMQNFSTLLTNMAASVQGAATGLLDMSVGSVLRAILESNAALALWMQWLMVQCLATTRLATSAGSDADSFGADFGFARLPAVAATGSVTFARFSPSVAAQVPVGTSVSTSGNTAAFVVVADPSNAAYQGDAAAYELAAGVASVTVAVTASVAGSAGNVQPGAISVLSSAIAGIDTVSNQAALTGGMDAETDTAFRVRFGSYLASLSRATNISIGAAIAATRQGL
ncbi:MAG: baseplate protein, partial [Acidocella sp. 20-61-6]